MQQLLQLVDGKKSYATAAALLVLAVLVLAGLVPGDTLDALELAAGSAVVASLKSAVKKLPAETIRNAERVRELLQTFDEAFPAPTDPQSPTPPPLDQTPHTLRVYPPPA